MLANIPVGLKFLPSCSDDVLRSSLCELDRSVSEAAGIPGATVDYLVAVRYSPGTKARLSPADVSPRYGSVSLVVAECIGARGLGNAVLTSCRIRGQCAEELWPLTISLTPIPHVELFPPRGRQKEQFTGSYAAAHRLRKLVQQNVFDIVTGSFDGPEVGREWASYLLHKLEGVPRLAQLFRFEPNETGECLLCTFIDCLKDVFASPAAMQQIVEISLTRSSLRDFLISCDEKLLRAWGRNGMARQLQTIGVCLDEWLAVFD